MRHVEADWVKKSPPGRSIRCRASGRGVRGPSPGGEGKHGGLWRLQRSGIQGDRGAFIKPVFSVHDNPVAVQTDIPVHLAGKRVFPLEGHEQMGVVHFFSVLIKRHGWTLVKMEQKQGLAASERVDDMETVFQPAQPFVPVAAVLALGGDEDDSVGDIV